MGKYEDSLSRLDAATNAVAAKIVALKEESRTILANSGATQAEEDAHLAKFDAIADRLTGLAADPADPIPAEEEPTEETPAAEPSDLTEDIPQEPLEGEATEEVPQ